MSKCYWSLVLKLWVSENNGEADASDLESNEGAGGRSKLDLTLTCMVVSLADRMLRNLSKSWSRSLTAR